MSQVGGDATAILDEPSAGGSWRVQHEHLAALLARQDLCWELARVYLALADLTLGYQKARDVVSLSQIGAATGMGRPHVVRSLRKLAELGLYGQERSTGQKMVRWVVWPPVAKTGTCAEPGTCAEEGNTPVAAQGNTTVAKPVARPGTHQDTKKAKNGKKERRLAPPDPQVKVFVDWFSRTYEQRIGRPYIVAGGKDGRLTKQLLQGLAKKGPDALGTLQKAAEQMFADRWCRDKASISLLSSQINQLLRGIASMEGEKHDSLLQLGGQGPTPEDQST